MKFNVKVKLQRQIGRRTAVSIKRETKSRKLKAPATGEWRGVKGGISWRSTRRSDDLCTYARACVCGWRGRNASPKWKMWGYCCAFLIPSSWKFCTRDMKYVFLFVFARATGNAKEHNNKTMYATFSSTPLCCFHLPFPPAVTERVLRSWAYCCEVHSLKRLHMQLWMCCVWAWKLTVFFCIFLNEKKSTERRTHVNSAYHRHTTRGKLCKMKGVIPARVAAVRCVLSSYLSL